jgi:hypothetical protein
MKGLLLMLAAGTFAVSAVAQEKSPNVGKTPINSRDILYSKITRGSNAVKKTTAATDRWYDYVGYYDTSQSDLGGTIAFSAPYLWNDSSSVDAFADASGGTVYEHNTTVNMGTILDPTFSGFNDYLYYPGEMKVTATNTYTLDSIIILGIYGFNPAKTSVVDTIRVTILYGADIHNETTTNSTILTRYGATGSLAYVNIDYDSATNKAFGSTAVTRDIILDNSGSAPAWGDTTSNGIYVGVLGFTPISIPAGSKVSATYTFKTGDPAFTFGDTVFSSVMGYKYNMLRPYVAFNGTSTAPLWAPYSASNKNTGLFKTLPDSENGWGGSHIPMWFWSSSATGSRNQFPWMQYHLACPTCGVVTDPGSGSGVGVNGVIAENSVSALPNPANGTLVVKYTQTRAADVTVSLTNMLGQEVASQQGSNGQATFNTAALPAGIYMYAVSANGTRSTGRVVVAH